MARVTTTSTPSQSTSSQSTSSQSSSSDRRSTHHGRQAPWQLRAAFARRMAETYGREVPAYTTLVEVSAAVNAEVVARQGADSERLGSIERVTAERHGAIRVGTPHELAQVSRIFAALGMFPVGFYDLRDAPPAGVPVVSTAFRPVDAEELARNPFRMFTSLLVTDDRRFFSADLQERLERFLGTRTLFGERLLELAGQAIAEDGLGDDDAHEFLTLATDAFTLSDEPVDRAWYAELEAVSSVAADIGGTASTHINHLTPRVLDIDELYRRMSERGITMIDTIQGPPRWDGADVLLRQTSFRALAEGRRFRETDGSVVPGSLAVRFGEVEQRGIALTPLGRERYDGLLAEIDARCTADPTVGRDEVAQSVWTQGMPTSERGVHDQGLGYFTYAVGDRDRVEARRELGDLLDCGALIATPIVYEDFLPRSAAGIFASNLAAQGSRDDGGQASTRDADWLAGVLGTELADPFTLYANQSEQSLHAALGELGLR